MNSKRTIAVLGGTGMTGKYVIDAALGSGFSVKALIRNPAKLTPRDNLSLIVGDVADSDRINELVVGTESVISCVGPTKLNKDLAAAMVCSTATRNLIQVMKTHGVRRYVVVSSASVTLPTDLRTNFMGWFTSFIAPLFVGDILKDKVQELELLQASDLDWTLVRCPIIRNRVATGSVAVNRHTLLGNRVRAPELAEFLVQQIDDEQYIKQGVFVTSSWPPRRFQ